MPSRHTRARLATDDPVHVIRARYGEAIRAGATILEATAYANADPANEPAFTKSVPVEVSLPIPKESKRDPAAIVGERDMLMPAGWSDKDKPPAPKAVDLDIEAVKRPMASQATPAPVSPAATVSTSVETRAPAESPPTVSMPPLLPGWDDPEKTTWPELRSLCQRMGMPAPNNRTTAVKSIRAKLAADDAAATAQRDE